MDRTLRATADREQSMAKLVGPAVVEPRTVKHERRGPAQPAGAGSRAAVKAPGDYLEGRRPGRQVPRRETVRPVMAGLGMSGGHRRQVVPAARARQGPTIPARDPAEPVSVLALLARDHVLLAAEEQDGAVVGIEKIDLPGGARHRNPFSRRQLRLCVGRAPPVSAAPLVAVRVGAISSVAKATIEDHLHLRVGAERMAQLLAPVRAGTTWGLQPSRLRSRTLPVPFTVSSSIAVIGC